jgi:anaerobic magnesium-protoporphyrin IX monomethyl ester cyclase
MKPHITLVNPPTPQGSMGHLPFALLGLGYLAAVLEKNNYKVDVIDCQALKLTYEETKNEIKKRQPDIIGVTSTTLTYKSGLKIVQLAKEVNPNILTVMGGPHITFWDQQALEECPQLDVVVRREGEYTVLELVQKVEANQSFQDIQGITYRNNGQITRNPDRPYIENLDELPFPARHLWPMEQLRKTEDILYLTTSRGCVYWCNFCATVRMHGRKYRWRSPENVVDELEFLHKTYGVVTFTFCDDAFTVDQARTEKLCKEILDRKLKIKWNCGTRVDMLTKELLAKMKAAGCISVWFGVESGSQQVLDEMKKGITTEQTIKVLGWVREVGLKPVPNVILGFPSETKKTAWKTIKYAEKLSPDDLPFYNIATPFPGTPMYDQVIENGWLKVTDFDKYDTATPIFETPWLSMRSLKKIRQQAFYHFYLRPSYFLDNRRIFRFSTALTVAVNFIATIKLKLKAK